MSSGRSIDHAVIAVDDLDATASRYEALGFTLTPRARHDDSMGTSNRLVQFEGHNFIELLEVDRPQTLVEHALDADPPRFSFGAHNRAFVAKHEGMSTCVFAGDDARADIAAFERAGIQTYAPFDFERSATLPDGSEVRVAFSLAFATSPDMPDLAYFTCQNRFPRHFWKPQFQRHANGARSIVEIFMAADDPSTPLGFLSRLYGGEITPVDGGGRVACGAHQSIVVIEPAQIARLAPGTAPPGGDGPQFAGMTIETNASDPTVISPDRAGGVFIRLRATS